MRKCLLLLLLLAILPFQFSWGAAAPYCRHPAGTGSAHFGHHQHQQKSGLGDKSAELKLKSVGAGDDDCVVCHFNPMHPVLDMPQEFAEGAVDAPASPERSRFCSHIPIGLERPDRSLAL